MGKVQIDKELDLLRVVKRLRVQMTATLGLLTKEQYHFSEKFAHIVVQDSNAVDTDSSSGDEYSADEAEFRNSTN